MAQNTATDDSDRATIEILYVRGAHSRSSPGVDPDEQPALFKLTRDLTLFAEDTFEQCGVTPEQAITAAYASIGEPVEIPTADFDDVDDLLEHVYRTAQGPEQAASIPYDGSEHRSMSKGDVIVVDGEYYMVASFGFEQLDVEIGVDDRFADDRPSPSIPCETCGALYHGEGAADGCCDDVETDGGETELHVPDDDCVVITDGGEALVAGVGDRVLVEQRGDSKRTGEVIEINRDRPSEETGPEYVVDLDGAGQAHVTAHALIRVGEIPTEGVLMETEAAAVAFDALQLTLELTKVPEIQLPEGLEEGDVSQVSSTLGRQLAVAGRNS